jgi:hypothetical protein
MMSPTLKYLMTVTAIGGIFEVGLYIYGMNWLESWKNEAITLEQKANAARSAQLASYIKEGKLANERLNNPLPKPVKISQISAPKKTAFENQYIPRAECNDPNLEWSKFVKCTNEKITARDKFQALYKTEKSNF